MAKAKLSQFIVIKSRSKITKVRICAKKIVQNNDFLSHGYN